MRSPRPSSAGRSAGLTLLVGALLSISIPADAATWPADALELLPPDPVVVVAAPSLAGIETKLADLVGRFDAGKAEEVDLLGEVSTWAGPYLASIDPDRPFLFSMNMTEAGGGMGPFAFTFVAALQSEAALPDSAGGFSLIGRDGPWVAVASSAALETSGRVPELARDLPEEDVVARADVATLAATFGPLIEMGLAGALAGGAEDGPAMPEAQAAALLDVVRVLMSSVQTLEATLGGGDDLRFSAALELTDGSPLSAPSPQPSMRRAMELAGYLPADASFHQVAAIDLSPWNELLIPTWESSLAPMAQAAGMTPRELAERLLFMFDLYYAPNAMSFDFADEGLEMTLLFEVDDAAGMHASIEQSFGEMATPRFPFYLAPRGSRAYEDWSIHRYALEYDIEGMAALYGEEDEDMQEAMGMVSMILGVVTAWLPPLDIAVHDDRLVASMHAGQGDTELLLQRMNEKPATPAPLDRALEWAGRDARVVSTLDVRTLLQGAVDMFSGMAELETVPEGPPAPLDFAVEAEAERLFVRGRLDLEALDVVVDAIRSWTSDAAEADDEEAFDVDSMETGLSAPTGGTIGAMSEDEVAELTDSLRERVEELRGHQFLHEVPVQVVSDVEARQFFVERMTESMPPQWMRSYQDMLIDLQQLPPSTDLEALVYELLEEQAGGFYDPGSGIFYLLDDMPRSTASMIIVHELTHALDDQLYDLDSMLLDPEANDDARAAVSAVVEGSGTLAMTQFLMQEMMNGRMSQADLLDFQESEAGKAEALESAPTVLKRGMLAPYLLGNAFLLRGEMANVVAGLDPDDVDLAFREPPVSMEQILHPVKYWDEAMRDLPRRVVIPDLEKTAGNGWTTRWEGSLGELDLAMLTQDPDHEPGMMELAMGSGWTNPAAEGWDGDSWVLLERGDQTVTVLAVVWDDEDEATEFAETYRAPTGAFVRQKGDRVVIVAGELPGRAEVLAEKTLEGLEVD